MSILFFSDIHGNVNAVEDIIRVIENEKPDMTVFLGDYLYHGPRNPLTKGYDCAAVAVLLNQIDSPVIAVGGNCDSNVDQVMLDFPIEAPYSQIVEGKRTFFLTHGHLFSPDRLPKLSNGDIFAAGHTHIPVLEERGGIIILNPGSVTLPKGGSKRGYALYRDNTLSLASFEEGIFQRMILS